MSTLLRNALVYVLAFLLMEGVLLAYLWWIGSHMSDEVFVIAVIAPLLLAFAVGLRDRRRGKPPGVTAPDPGQLLRASLFVLALGGFGLLTTAFTVWRYPNFDRLGFGVLAACCGYMTVLGLLGIRRARR
jgi:hypothetical protein